MYFNYKLKSSYPVGDPRQAILLWFVNGKPHNARELQYYYFFKKKDF